MFTYWNCFNKINIDPFNGPQLIPIKRKTSCYTNKHPFKDSSYKFYQFIILLSFSFQWAISFSTFFVSTFHGSFTLIENWLHSNPRVRSSIILLKTFLPSWSNKNDQKFNQIISPIWRGVIIGFVGNVFFPCIGNVEPKARNT